MVKGSDVPDIAQYTQIIRIPLIRYWQDMSKQPLLSVIVVFFNMQREAPRTLHSLTRAYQRQSHDLDYEVIAIDNGSSEPLDEAAITGLGREFRYFYLETASVSPAGAINVAATKANGRYVMVCIDGARILSPGLLHHTALATRLDEKPIVTTFNWHLGKKVQNEAIHEKYNQCLEDALLNDAGWQTDGYRLFEVSSPALSSANGWFLPFAESNCLTVSRSMFDALGGFDERFCAPGGGIVNLDFLKRACELPQSKLIVLLGEGTFHQFHGGVATNVPREKHPWNHFAREYERVRGEPYAMPQKEPLFIGTMPHASLPFLYHSTSKVLERHQSTD